MLPSRLMFVLGLLALVTGCDRKPPTGPSTTSLAIAGADAVLTGLSAGYSATATASDGSTRTVTPTWTSGNPGVASVDGAGRLDGRAHGSTTLTATFEGRSVSKTVQVVNNYEGTWKGRYVIRACDDSGIFEDGIYGGAYSDVPSCQGLDAIGTVHSISLALSQFGSNYGEIRATLAGYGAPGDTITGIVTADGRLNLAGRLKVLDHYGDPWGEWHLGEWDTNLDTSGQLTGRWAQNLTIFGQQGNLYQQAELVTMTRMSTSVLPASPIH